MKDLGIYFLHIPFGVWKDCIFPSLSARDFCHLIQCSKYLYSHFVLYKPIGNQLFKLRQIENSQKQNPQEDIIQKVVFNFSHWSFILELGFLPSWKELFEINSPRYTNYIIYHLEYIFSHPLSEKPNFIADDSLFEFFSHFMDGTPYTYIISQYLNFEQFLLLHILCDALLCVISHDKHNTSIAQYFGDMLLNICDNTGLIFQKLSESFSKKMTEAYKESVNTPLISEGINMQQNIIHKNAQMNITQQKFFALDQGIRRLIPQIITLIKFWEGDKTISINILDNQIKVLAIMVCCKLKRRAELLPLLSISIVDHCLHFTGYYFNSNSPLGTINTVLISSVIELCPDLDIFIRYWESFYKLTIRYGSDAIFVYTLLLLYYYKSINLKKFLYLPKIFSDDFKKKHLLFTSLITKTQSRQNELLDLLPESFSYSHIIDLKISGYSIEEISYLSRKTIQEIDQATDWFHKNMVNYFHSISKQWTMIDCLMNNQKNLILQRIIILSRIDGSENTTIRLYQLMLFTTQHKCYLLLSTYCEKYFPKWWYSAIEYARWIENSKVNNRDLQKFNTPSINAPKRNLRNCSTK